MSAPRPGSIHETAVIGGPPEHRDYDDHFVAMRPYIAPTAQINAFCTVDSGTERRTSIGARTFLMAHCHIGHDSQIGEDVELAAGTIIAGHVTIKDGARLGVNVCVKPRITIGAGARIGAGAVVVKDVPAGETWVGNPAREIGAAKSDASIWREAYDHNKSALDLLREAYDAEELADPTNLETRGGGKARV
jgi:acyl-[acyl carrier protein]--UDP-N-acetylglucosamine O-acyltransferase